MALPIQPFYAPCDIHNSFIHFRLEESTARPQSAPPHACFLDIAPCVQEESPMDEKQKKNKQLSKQARELEEEIAWREWRSQVLRETWCMLARKFMTKVMNDCVERQSKRKLYLRATLTKGGQRHMLIRLQYALMEAFCLTRIRVLRQIPGSHSYEIWSSDEMMEMYPQVQAIVGMAKEIQKLCRSRFFVHTTNGNMPVTYIPKMTVGHLSRLVGIRNATKKVWKINGKDLPVSSVSNTMGALKVRPGSCVEVY